jgi:DNA-binding MarR family transcriptional regulator
LVERRADPADRRIKRLHLLPPRHNWLSRRCPIVPKTFALRAPDYLSHSSARRRSSRVGTGFSKTSAQPRAVQRATISGSS